MSWTNLGDMLADKAYDDFKVGQTLTFKLEDDETHFKIMRIDKQRQKFWVKQIKFMTAEEIGVAMTKNELKRRDNAAT